MIVVAVTEWDVIFRTIMDFVTKLGKHPRYCNAVLWVHCEANDWTKADKYCKELLRGPYWPGKVVADSNDDPEVGRLGVYTDEDTKVEWTAMLKGDFEDERIYYATDLISSDPDKFKHTFEEQVRFWREEQKLPQDPVFGTTRVKIIGKGMGGKKDDIACAYLLAATRQMAMRHDPRWERVADGFNVII